MRYTLFLLILTLLSCTEPIDFPLDKSSNALIVEGWVWTRPPYCQVKLSRSKAYLAENNEFPGIPNATVIVKELETGITDTLLYRPDTQWYQAQKIQGKPRHHYRLDIYVDGKHFWAQTAIPDTVPIAIATFVYHDATLLTEAGYRPLCVAKEPDTFGNYYRLLIYKGDSLFDGPFDRPIFDDQFINGRSLFFMLPYAFQKGDTATVELQTITHATYQFFESIEFEQSSSSPYTPPPENILSNIQSDDPNTMVFGWFGGLGSTRSTKIVP